MSQKTVLTRVRVHGSVYLGEQTQPDGTRVPVWSNNPDAVMGWLCDGFRVRFNQHRSKRSRYLTCRDRDNKHTLVTTSAGARVLVPIGRSVTDVTDSQARAQYSFLAAIPAMVLQAPTKIENTDWFAATKRRRTRAAKGARPGPMPGFRRRRDDSRFVCWFNGGANATFTKTGRRSGMVTIGGQNPSGLRAPDGTFRWKITVHVRLSQDIRSYTSMRVNWTRREVVFVNAPLPVTARASTGATVGLDRGIAHTVADSDGRFHDAPDTAELEKQRRWHQKRMAKSALIAKREHRQFWASHRYQDHKSAAAALSARQARIRDSFAHQTSTALVREYDFIGIEDLQLANMVRRAKGAGASSKRGLNRSLHRAALSRLATFIKYKADAAGTLYVPVNPAYTSQRCHQCSHTARENRESQAVFSCTQCGWTGNADTNAALNIRHDALVLWAAEHQAEARTRGLAGSKGRSDPHMGSSFGSAAPAMNRKPSEAAA